LYNSRKNGYGEDVKSFSLSYEPQPTGAIFTTGGPQ